MSILTLARTVVKSLEWLECPRLCWYVGIFWCPWIGSMWMIKQLSKVWAEQRVEVSQVLRKSAIGLASLWHEAWPLGIPWMGTQFLEIPTSWQEGRGGLFFWFFGSNQEIGGVGVGEAVSGLKPCADTAPPCWSGMQTEIEWLLTFFSKKDSFVFQRWARRQRPCGHCATWGTLQWWSDCLFSGLWQLWVRPRLRALNQSSKSLEVWHFLSSLKGCLSLISTLSTSPFHSLMVSKIILEKPFGGFYLRHGRQIELLFGWVKKSCINVARVQGACGGSLLHYGQFQPGCILLKFIFV